MTTLDLDEARKSTDPCMIPVLCNVILRMTAQIEGMQRQRDEAKCDAETAKAERNREHIHTNRAACLLAKCRNMRQPTPGNWPGEPVLPGWMICRIDDVLKAIPAFSKASNANFTGPTTGPAPETGVAGSGANPCWMPSPPTGEKP